MKNFILLFLTLLLSACGNTSNLRSATSVIDFNQYDYVIVNDFTDATTKQGNNPNIISEGKRFADIIASSIMAKNKFKRVERNIDSTDKAILIDGKITKCDEGSLALRMIVGMGAGSSKFNAFVNIRDNETKQPLGVIDVSKMSWLLGGTLAGNMDVKSHMHSAASKIANECSIKKKSFTK